MIKIDREAIAKIDLTELSKFITDKEARDFFLAEKGEHYKLLAWLSMQYKKPLISDIGTYKGCSALALSYNKRGLIFSYDILNLRKLTKNPSNVRFYIEDCRNDFTLASDLIFLDTTHDGTHENMVINWLMYEGWKGVLVLDDIHHFPEQNKLWNEITLPKEDITEFCHWSGTGIIYFE